MLRLLPAYLSLVWLLLNTSAFAAEPQATALDDYVRQADTSFAWSKRREGKVGSTEYVELILTSQTWKDIPWKHQLLIIKPASLIDGGKDAFLFVSGGSWKAEYEQAVTDDALPRDAERFVMLAEHMQTPLALLLHVPHQPILGDKYEDEIIAYTFMQYLLTGDEQWPLLLPMVKSAVRGMDAVQAAAKVEWNLEIVKFTVAGASKRGWTTWLTSAVDPRVHALAPMVIDMLNMSAQLKHQVTTWGDYSNQIEDYTRLGLQKFSGTPAGQRLHAIVDPYAYRKRLTQPKLIILGTNDRYWPLDAANLYWGDLADPKYLLYVPNQGHGIKDDTRLLGTLSAFQRYIATKDPLPEPSWKFSHDDDSLTLEIQAGQGAQTRGWLATAPTRDFRDAQWEQITPAETAPEGATLSIPVPEKGFAALFGEMVYEQEGGKLPLFLSTNVQIIGGIE